MSILRLCIALISQVSTYLDQQYDSTLEEGFKNDRRLVLHGSTPLWLLGGIPSERTDVREDINTSPYAHDAPRTHFFLVARRVS